MWTLSIAILRYYGYIVTYPWDYSKPNHAPLASILTSVKSLAIFIPYFLNFSFFKAQRLRTQVFSSKVLQGNSNWGFFVGFIPPEYGVLHC